MARALSIFAAAVLASAALISCGGGSDAINTGGALFTDAPSTVTLDPGTQASFRLNGGSPLYSASSGNTNIVTTRVDGGRLILTGISAGSTSVSVVDTQGSKLTLTVAVVGAQGVGAPIALTPASLQVGNCTTRVPFLFSGGVAPYTVFTSDNFNVPVSSAISLGDGRFYFFADVHWPYPPTGFNPNQTLTVLDSQSRTAVATLQTPFPTNACPSNPLLTIFPESANFRMSEVRAFQISGGPATSLAPTVSFADAGVAEVVSVNPTTINVRACTTIETCPVRNNRTDTLMTVATSDGQRANVVINVLRQP